MKKLVFLSALFLALVASMAAHAAEGQGFTVIKNVNSGKPLVEKVVLFEKGKSAAHLSFEGAGRFSIDSEGALQLPITGFGEVKPIIRWKEGEGRPASFDPANYTFLLVTLSFEGTVQTKQPNGKTTETRPDNLWFSVALFDPKNQWPTIIGLAELTDDGKTPSKTTTLRIPLSLFAQSRNPEVDTKHINGIGFYWSKTRENVNRDFHLVIEKIALAD